MQHLETVDLSECSISAAGATALAVAVAAPSSRLQSLALSRNDLQSDGVQALASAAASSPALETLLLDDCHVGDDGELPPVIPAGCFGRWSACLEGCAMA